MVTAASGSPSVRSDQQSTPPGRPPFVGMIWAQSKEGIIGDGEQMPWHLPEDLTHFKDATLGAPVIMGRRTWDSLNPRFRPLPGRLNIVLSRSQSLFDGAEHAPDLQSALAMVADEPKVWIIGGGRVYREGLHIADECVVTDVDIVVDLPRAVTAPSLDGWEVRDSSEWQTSKTGLRYRFRTLVRAE